MRLVPRIGPSGVRRRGSSSWLAGYLLPLVLLLTTTTLLLAGGTSARDGKPTVSVSKFTSLPSRVYYFVDSPVVLWHSRDEKQVWRSEDEGKTWNKVKGDMESHAHLLLEHPFDKSTVSPLFPGLLFLSLR